MWLLGPADEEIRAVEALLSLAGEGYDYALVDGRRANADNKHLILPNGEYNVKCGPGTIEPDLTKPAEMFMFASAIGQVIMILARRDTLVVPRMLRKEGEYETRYYFHVAKNSWTLQHGSVEYLLPEDAVYAAAYFFKKLDAYRGYCPGIDPDKLLYWRAAQYADGWRRSISGVLNGIEKARKVLRERAVDGLADIRGLELDYRHEAAYREGVAYLAETQLVHRKKIVLVNGTPEQVEQFMSGTLVPGLIDRHVVDEGHAAGYYG